MYHVPGVSRGYANEHLSVVYTGCPTVEATIDGPAVIAVALKQPSCILLGGSEGGSVPGTGVGAGVVAASDSSKVPVSPEYPSEKEKGS